MTISSNGIIDIDAFAKRFFEPDQFCVRVDFEGSGDDKAECVRAYNRDHARVLAALEKAGIPADEVVSGAFRVSAHYEWYYEKDEDYPYERYRRTERYADGYEYIGDCSFERKMDLELLAAIWGALQETEGDFTFEITYSMERPDECERELLQAAVAEARSRAEVLASAAGVQLGEVAMISHSFKHATYGDFGRDMVYLTAPSAYNDDDSSAPDFNPAPIAVSCEVSIGWLIV